MGQKSRLESQSEITERESKAERMKWSSAFSEAQVTRATSTCTSGLSVASWAWGRPSSVQILSAREPLLTHVTIRSPIHWTSKDRASSAWPSTSPGPAVLLLLPPALPALPALPASPPPSCWMQQMKSRVSVSQRRQQLLSSKISLLRCTNNSSGRPIFASPGGRLGGGSCTGGLCASLTPYSQALMQSFKQTKSLFRTSARRWK
mmetsp:Transcript_14310/g.40987  ORF Transcript_14310/g.40987 Transcript_14310/m.40987 type:complete len:205 (-) Transcript_14310:183-797(-)